MGLKKQAKRKSASSKKRSAHAASGFTSAWQSKAELNAQVQRLERRLSGVLAARHQELTDVREEGERLNHRYRKSLARERARVANAGYLGAARAMERLVMRLCPTCSLQISDFVELHEHAKAKHKEFLSDATLNC